MPAPVRCPNCMNFLALTGQSVGGRMRVRCKKCGMTVSIRMPGEKKPTAGDAAEPPAQEPAPPPPEPAPSSADDMLVSAPPEPVPTDRGDLGATPVAVTLAKLWKEKFTGTLHVATPAGEHRLMLRAGELVSYATADPRARLLTVLRDHRKITVQVHDEWAAQGMRDEELSEKLIHAGVCDQPKITAAWVRGAETAVNGLCAASGSFRIEAGPSGPRRVKVVMEKLVLDALRQGVPEAVVRRGLPELARQLRFVQDALPYFQSLPLTDDEQRLLTLVDGKRTFGDLLVAAPEQAMAIRSVYALLAFGVLEQGPLDESWEAPEGFELASPPASAAPAPPPSRPPAAVPPPAAARASAQPPRAAEAPSPASTRPEAEGSGFTFDTENRAADAAGSDTAEDGDKSVAEFIFDVPAVAPAAGAKAREVVAAAMKPAPWVDADPTEDLSVIAEELRVVMADLEGADYYQMLHVSPDADEKAIKRAYFAFAKRYHPDKFFSIGDDALREQVDNCYTQMTIAFETLKSPERRSVYELSLRKPPEEVQGTQNDTIVAELKYQEGHAAFLRKNYAEAIELLGWALRLNGAKAKYHALLGRCYFQDSEEKRDLAMAFQAFQKASELEPTQPLHRVHMGQALNLQGKVAEARKMFQQALYMDKDNIEAKREIRLIDMRASAATAPGAKGGKPSPPAKPGKPEPEKKKGFFGKLLGKG